MEAQGLSQGSLRNSHRETHAVKRKRAPALFQELARKLVESCSHDLILRQRLDPERAEIPLKRGTFFALENEGRAEPGFLVFLPGKPAVYLQLRRGIQASTLRMRVSETVAEGGGSVLIATLDDVMHSLRLEDVWMWRGEALVGKETYTKRRERLKEFVQYHWVPDARLLGGIFTTVAQPLSMEKFSEKKEWDTCHSVEFIPDMPGKRRMIWYLEAQQKAAEAHAGLKQLRTGVAAPSAAPLAAAQLAAPLTAAPLMPADGQRRVRAVPADRLPDVYDLYGEDGFPISRASVQQFALSKTLRTATEGG
jgi:hypothetical protein